MNCTGAFSILFVQMLYCVDDDLGAVLDAKDAGIQAEVIVLRLAPCTAGVVMVIHTTALILFLKAGFGALLRLSVETHDALGTIGSISKDIDVECVLSVLEDVVCVAAYDDAGALVRQLQDHIALDVPKEISGRQSVHDTGNTLRSESIRKEAASGGMFAVLLNELGSKAGFKCDLIH